MNVDIPDLPVCAKAPTIYVSTDKQAEEAGCAWGLLVAHDSKGGDFWVMTALGVRYYGLYSEHVFLTREDPRWAAVHATWQVAFGRLAEEQKRLAEGA